MSTAAKLYVGAAILVVLGAVLFRAAGYWAPAWMGASAGGAVLLFAIGALYKEAKANTSPTRILLGFLTVFAWAAFIEAVGLLTNLPFGSYRYTNLWPPYLHLRLDVLFPIFLPLSWTVLGVGASYAVSDVKSRWLRILLVPLLATAVDLGLESVMTGPALLWYWNQPVTWFGAPWMNFAGWFGAFAVVAIIIESISIKPQASRLGMLLIGSAAILNAVVGLAYSKWPALAGLIAIPVLWVVRSLSPEEDSARQGARRLQ